MKWLLALLVLLAAPLHAQQREWADTQLPDAAQEAAARDLMETLRCVTCQSQSIADSNADLAAEMRDTVRRRIRDGESPDAVRGWLVRRYGDYVTYDPQVSRTTWPLFAIPAMLVLLVGLTLWRRLRRR